VNYGIPMGYGKRVGNLCSTLAVVGPNKPHAYEYDKD
jgi:hypothetical protein